MHAEDFMNNLRGAAPLRRLRQMHCEMNCDDIAETETETDGLALMSIFKYARLGTRRPCA